MSGDEAREWRTTTDREHIESVADAAGAVPTLATDADGEPEPRIETDPAGDAVEWPAFFEAFDADRQAVRYRESAAGVDPATVAVVDSETAEVDSSETTEEPDDVDADQVATSDTGDPEPVAFDRTETEPTGAGDVEEASTAPTGDAERGPPGPARGLVLDEIHENPLGSDDHLEEEYVVFENDGDASIDLSGWTVENEAGRSYRFPDGTVLDPDESVTLHSGRGEDAGDDLYWGESEPVWGNRRDTVVVRTAAGERVIREPYEA